MACQHHSQPPTEQPQQQRSTFHDFSWDSDKQVVITSTMTAYNTGNHTHCRDRRWSRNNMDCQEVPNLSLSLKQ